MPLLLTRQSLHNTQLAVWHSTEEDNFFIEALGLSSDELVTYHDMRPHRRKEWLTSRYLLHRLGRDSVRRKVQKDLTGKPYRLGCNRFISLSHSRDYVAAIISDRPTGIDIQRKEEKIARIQHKFITDEESAALPGHKHLDYYHVFWGAKESMYKAYGLRKLDFKDHMHLYPFRILDGTTTLRGYVHKGDVHQDYMLEMERVDGAFLVHCVKDAYDDSACWDL